MGNITESWAKTINSRNRLKEDVQIVNPENVDAGVGSQETPENGERYLSFDMLEIQEPAQEDTCEDGNIGYVELAYAAVCAGCDFKHIHLHARGQMFDTIHAIANEYYDKAAEDEDLVAEIALETGCRLGNFGRAGNYLNWDFVDASEYNYEEAIILLRETVFKYITFLDKATALSQGDIKAKLEELQRYWKKELEYKLSRRL